MESIVL
jgi:hypothetical protein